MVSRCFTGTGSAPARLPTIGIATCLAVAFVAVAAFVLLAISIVRPETVVVLANRAPSRPSVAAAPVGEAAVVAPPVQRAANAPAPSAYEAPALLGMRVERFRLAFRNRLASDSSEVEYEYGAAVRALRQASAAQAPGPIQGLVNRLLERHAALIDLADRRRGQYAAMREHATRLVAETERSVDSAFRIFGRVVIRQSLKDLAREAAGIRHVVDDMARIEGYGPETLGAMEAAERRFMATLDGSADVLRRSQGRAWVESVEQAFVSMALARRGLVTLDRRWTTAQNDAQGAATAVDAYVARGARVRLSASAGSGQAVAAPPARGPARRLGTHTLLPRATVSAQSSVRVTATAGNGDGGMADLLRVAGAFVVALLLGLCVVTGASIVRPVRRLVAAAEGVARGAQAVRVPRGGIREFDTLAAAFNHMAEQLDGARRVADEYRRSLEDRVEQRTQQLQHLADHDPLTGLPNRRRLLELLERELERARTSSGCVGVYFVDLDNFKHINDTMGHAFGDRLLRVIADRLREVAGPAGLAARFGGDEFTVIATDATSVGDLEVTGNALVRAFQSPVRVDERELLVGVSVGASLQRPDEQDAATLLREADVALFRAKQLGRNQLALFTPDLLEMTASRFTTEQKLRRAVERGEFELVFQPELDAVTLRVELVEALLRWRQPDGTLTAPGDFMAVAEETGLIMDIGDWVVDAAIRTLAGWRRDGRTDLRVAINVSPRQLLEAGFEERLRSLLAQHAMPPEAIEIELTESVVQTGVATIDALRRLRALGVGIALDDFGSGYSSLASLEQLPLTRVKLDRGLVDGVDGRDRSRAIAGSLARLCIDLGLQITAEGIERPEQLRHFLGMPGVKLQGYLLSRPLPADAIPAFAWAPPEDVASLLLEGQCVDRTLRPAMAELRDGYPAIRRAS